MKFIILYKGVTLKLNLNQAQMKKYELEAVSYLNFIILYLNLDIVRLWAYKLNAPIVGMCLFKSPHLYLFFKILIFKEGVLIYEIIY